MTEEQAVDWDEVKSLRTRLTEARAQVVVTSKRAGEAQKEHHAARTQAAKLETALVEALRLPSEESAFYLLGKDRRMDDPTLEGVKGTANGGD